MSWTAPTDSSLRRLFSTPPDAALGTSSIPANSRDVWEKKEGLPLNSDRGPSWRETKAAPSWASQHVSGSNRCSQRKQRIWSPKRAVATSIEGYVGEEISMFEKMEWSGASCTDRCVIFISLHKSCMSCAPPHRATRWQNYVASANTHLFLPFSSIIVSRMLSPLSASLVRLIYIYIYPCQRQNN